jgi:pimeloyl-ACP methyl ester carboxylesterase
MAHGDSTRATTRTVRVGDADIHVTEWGAGPPVLLLHGNPDSGIMWEGVADRMAAQYRCIAPDLLGFGHSQVPSDFQRSLAGLSQFIEKFLAAADIPRPVDLVAHDFGGPFAFAWAVEHPDSVRHMVAINTLFFSDYRWHFWARVWRTPILGELSMLGLNRTMFARELRRGSKAISDAHIDRVWSLMTPTMRKEVLRLYRATDSAHFGPWESAFLKLVRTKPTLVVWGDKDPYVPSRFAERFNAENVVHLPQAGHWAAVEVPGECADAVRRFFSAAA